MNPTTLTGGEHGTKWIGVLGVVASAVSGINPATLPPSWLPYIAGFLSLATLARGFVNTTNQQQPPTIR